MKYVNALEPNEECKVTIVFGRYAKKGQYYYAIPETVQDLHQILQFEKSTGFNNVDLYGTPQTSGQAQN